jgi:hypothetical protein
VQGIQAEGAELVVHDCFHPPGPGHQLEHPAVDDVVRLIRFAFHEGALSCCAFLAVGLLVSPFD